MSNSTSLLFPGQGRFRTQTQRRYVLVQWSMFYDRAVILKRSDSLQTLAKARRVRGNDSARIFDTVTREVIV